MVQETEKRIPGTRRRSLRVRVVFPVPLGAERTNTIPRRIRPFSDIPLPCRFRGRPLHSMFWICSRNLSTSALIRSMACEIRRSSDFEPIVLTSRCISWTRKSRDFPTG